jgi:hypothetical protein
VLKRITFKTEVQMTLQSRLVVAFVACHVVEVVGSGLNAQEAKAAGRNQWAVAIAVDGGSIPSGFGGGCGSDATDFLGGGASVLFRPRPGLVASVDTRMSGSISGCKVNTVLPVPTPILPNDYETVTKTYPNGVPSEPLVRTALHVGVETPRSPWLRATVGGGMIWSGGSLPFGSVAIGGSTPGRVRLHWGVETSVTRVRVREEHARYLLDPATFTQTLLTSRSTSYVQTLRWTSFQLGVEIPVLGSY